MLLAQSSIVFMGISQEPSSPEVVNPQKDETHILLHHERKGSIFVPFSLSLEQLFMLSPSDHLENSSSMPG